MCGSAGRGVAGLDRVRSKGAKRTLPGTAERLQGELEWVAGYAHTSCQPRASPCPWRVTAKLGHGAPGERAAHARRAVCRCWCRDCWCRCWCRELLVLVLMRRPRLTLPAAHGATLVLKLKRAAGVGERVATGDLRQAPCSAAPACPPPRLSSSPLAPCPPSLPRCADTSLRARWARGLGLAPAPCAICMCATSTDYETCAIRACSRRSSAPLYIRSRTCAACRASGPLPSLAATLPAPPAACAG